MRSNALFVAAFLGIVVIALAIRLPQLDRRPMHADEAVHTYKFNELLQGARYEYDPAEFHGPTLYYCTYPALWLAGVASYQQSDAHDYRRVTVVFGAGLVCLLPLLMGGLGRAAVLWAGLFLALSPALVFYSRYYIQESLLVFFTLLLIVAGWRYFRRPHWGWALLGGVAAGLMQATKETSVLVYGALAVALIATRLSASEETTAGVAPRRARALWHVVLAGIVALGVACTLLSGFFAQPAGIADACRTYGAYFERAGGGIHAHPCYWYLELLVYTPARVGAPWTEGITLLLAIVGAVVSFRGRTSGGERPALLRFVAIYTFVLLLVYSAVPYKTPWCVLGPLQGVILLAGVGAASLVRWMRGTARLIAGIAVLAAGLTHVGWQTWRTNFLRENDVCNPWVYAPTVSDAPALARQLENIAALRAEHGPMLVKVIAANAWPLPWYLRRLEHVGYWESVSAEPDADVILAASALAGEVEGRLRGMYETFYRGLRRDEVLTVMIEHNLWRQYLGAMSADQP